jgi:uncharacterized ferritin-like protein (DUF455 family)
MMNFYEALEKILFESDVNTKIEEFNRFYEMYKAQKFDLKKQVDKVLLQSPSYLSFAKIVPPQVVPKRKNLTIPDGQKYLLHAIAHIEYSAIDLALDAAYRFEGMPKEYYDDWLEVAYDEIRHFVMLRDLLLELGTQYGEIEVHNALFEAMQRTQYSVLERMAIVPRYLEANGLDATPLILNKLEKLPKNPMLEKIINALHIILDEEISHVQKGDKWFSYICELNNQPKNIYFDIVEKYYPIWITKNKTLNIEARRQAGFTCKELETMVQHKVCEDEK